MKTSPLWLALTIISLASLQAATISYVSRAVFETSTTNTNASWYSPLSTLGTLVRAENSGGSAINIDFTLDGTTDIAFSAASFSFGSTYGGFYNAFASNNLINTGSYSGATGANLPLTGLTIGQNYLIQMLFADARGLGTASPRTISVDGTNMGIFNFNNAQDFNMDGVTGGTGSGGQSDFGYRSVIGYFKADATTQNIFIQGFNSDGSNAGPQLNAFQLRLIPEPSRAVLFLSAMIGVMMVRRRIE